MPNDFSKSEKKIARILIDKGVDTEFRTALEQADEIISEWKKGSLDNRTACHKLFSKIKVRDKRIATRYDGLTGSRWLRTIGFIYEDGQITEEDKKDLSEENKEILNQPYCHKAYAT
jgi:hypothetical protein